MAAQAPWTQHEPETTDDDRWYVMMAPGEVKILTLEQLDDLFRLEIIDENTSVSGASSRAAASRSITGPGRSDSLIIADPVTSAALGGSAGARGVSST